MNQQFGFHLFGSAQLNFDIYSSTDGHIFQYFYLDKDKRNIPKSLFLVGPSSFAYLVQHILQQETTMMAQG